MCLTVDDVYGHVIFFSEFVENVPIAIGWSIVCSLIKCNVCKSFNWLPCMLSAMQTNDYLKIWLQQSQW